MHRFRSFTRWGITLLLSLRVGAVWAEPNHVLDRTRLLKPADIQQMDSRLHAPPCSLWVVFEPRIPPGCSDVEQAALQEFEQLGCRPEEGLILVTMRDRHACLHLGARWPNRETQCSQAVSQCLVPALQQRLWTQAIERTATNVTQFLSAPPPSFVARFLSAHSDAQARFFAVSLCYGFIVFLALCYAWRRGRVARCLTYAVPAYIASLLVNDFLASGFSSVTQAVFSIAVPLLTMLLILSDGPVLTVPHGDGETSSSSDSDSSSDDWSSPSTFDSGSSSSSGSTASSDW